MIQKHPLLKSTAILTCAGMVSRIIGFFYRIFLSKTIGAEGIGIYLLLFPVQTLLFSLTSSGIQTAISRFVSARLASNDKKGARDILLCGMMLSVLFSGIASFFLYQNANFIAVSLLHEARCSSLLKILSFTLPFAGVHACIIGYYTGLKKAAVPAISQLVEQTARVASSFLFWQIMVEKGIQVTPVLAMYGMLTSEIIVVLYTGTRFLLHHPSSFEKACPFSAHSIREILTFSLPLSTNRVCLSLLQSAESICIPLRLQAFGLAKSAALSSYGTLTGMALPLVFFPSAVTNALSVMLLPASAQPAVAFLPEPQFILKCCQVSVVCFLYKKTFPEHTNFRGTKTSAFEMRPIQGGIEMNELSELDLQNLRHLIGGFDTTHCKMTAYAQEAGDPAVKQFFQKSAQSAMQCKQQLMTFLQ